jgi:hypothetical protein
MSAGPPSPEESEQTSIGSVVASDFGPSKDHESAFSVGAALESVGVGIGDFPPLTLHPAKTSTVNNAAMTALTCMTASVVA